MLSNLHKLLPSRLMDTLYPYKSEEDKKECMWIICFLVIHLHLLSLARWLKKNLKPVEDLHSAIQRLSLFGTIQSFSLCGRQSAIVVFRDMTSACRAVNAFQSRSPGTLFHCSWLHRFMSKDDA
ncbi:testis expressed protein 56-like [Rhynchocyon petersi]